MSRQVNSESRDKEVRTCALCVVVVVYVVCGGGGGGGSSVCVCAHVC